MKDVVPAIAFILAVLLTSCGGTERSDVIELRVGDQGKALQTLLVASGEDKPEGYRISWSNHVGGPSVIAAQTGGSVDVGWMGETPLVFSQAAGSPVKVVAVRQGLQDVSASVALVVSARSSIASIADLRGKKVGYSPGTITQYLVASELDQAGLSFDDIESVRLTAFNVANLDNGTVDAATIVQPNLSELLSEDRIRVLTYGDSLYYLTASHAALADSARDLASPGPAKTDVSTLAPNAVRIEGVTRSFHEQRVLDSLNITIAKGEFVALLGASGSGKTTLLRILAGLDAPDEGEAWVPQKRTVVFQEPRLVQSKSVWRNVVVGLSRRLATRDRAIQALSEVSLDHRADAWPATLSGGEAQRAALARALVREPELLLLDEPFAALDALTRLRMQRLIRDLCATHGPSTLLVTHDVEEAILLADRILVLKNGKIAFDERVQLPHPRRAGGETFDTLRARLLSQLGVHEDC